MHTIKLQLGGALSILFQTYNLHFFFPSAQFQLIHKNTTKVKCINDKIWDHE